MSMEKRNKRVSVFLTDDELFVLDHARGGLGRGRAIRLLLNGALPRPIPEVNGKLASDLSRALGNISSLAAASRAGGFVPESQLLPLLHEVRFLLLTGKSQLSVEYDEDEGATKDQSR